MPRYWSIKNDALNKNSLSLTLSLFITSRFQQNDIDTFFQPQVWTHEEPLS